MAFDTAEHQAILARTVQTFEHFHVFARSHDGRDLHYMASFDDGRFEWGVRRWQQIAQQGPDGTVRMVWRPALVWCSQLTSGREIGSLLDFIADGPEEGAGRVWYIGYNVAGTVDQGPLGPVLDPSPGGPIRAWWSTAPDGESAFFHMAYRTNHEKQAGQSHFLRPLDADTLAAAQDAIPLLGLSRLSFHEVRSYAADRGYDATGRRSAILQRICATSRDIDTQPAVDWDALSFRELQARAKAAGVSASGTRAAITQRLRDATP